MKKNSVKKWNKYTILSISIILLFVVTDQFLKVWVKSNMQIGEMFSVIGNWFLFYFVENEGMAFGISFGKSLGKILLTLIRIGVVSFLIYYLIKIIKNKKADFVIVGTFSLIIAGAIGNIIDSLFYGIIYDYAPFMMGHVVDMFYFPLFKIPDWIPLWGGSHFFPAIFNIADSCVTIGVFSIILFNKRFFPTHKTDQPQNLETDATPSQQE
ncbi:MAG: lipoprotein signal peptidase [Bacteroidetes bacterium HGW-Bacteroidetes-19]|nr:MAG: lipoprotein signal peptidase [Bacteroidetes bacterium HGW-Bacteroidetes-19]